MANGAFLDTKLLDVIDEPAANSETKDGAVAPLAWSVHSTRVF
jgi:hypothetical protein